jgi:hypothetical protein
MLLRTVFGDRSEADDGPQLLVLSPREVMLLSRVHPRLIHQTAVHRLLSLLAAARHVLCVSSRQPWTGDGTDLG